ncbi:MAG: type II toxin-antitoxin system prevent-host-death family antitoxin [Rhodospirillales bacterium]|nr:type II toxin-antitoxin system prevent-host-death family antitoxin [Rhodospirillales bacterium]MDE0712817.1 type II toxin-antitoxin system prevent-host-death family antitoxin [Rhodospirillales bacterium]
METTKASDFKARCLAVLDRVSATGKSAVILKHGRPVAELRPVRSVDVGRPQSRLVGTVTVVRDIVGPVVAEGEWEALRL